MSSKRIVFSITGVLTSGLIWGLIWYPFRALQEAGLSGALATLMAYLLALVFGVFMLPCVWRERKHAGWWTLWLLLASGWTNFSYVLAMLGGQVMRVLLLFYLAPLWTILFSYWLLDERLNRYGYFVITLSLCGAMIMLWEPQLGLPLPQNTAEWIALSSGMAFALANVVSRRANHLTPETKSISVIFGTGLLTVPWLLWQGDLARQVVAIALQPWLILIMLGITILAISYVVQYSVSHLAANHAIVLFLFELVVAAVSSYLLADEAMKLRDWFGAVLIISATLLSGRLYDDAEEGGK